jgi:hypothetical protein
VELGDKMTLKRNGEKYKAIGVQTDDEEEDEEFKKKYEELIKGNGSTIGVKNE